MAAPRQAQLEPDAGALVVFGGEATVSGPGDGAEAFGGNTAAGFLAIAVDAFADAVERAIDFEEFVFFGAEFGPEQIAVELFLSRIH